jgi:hypothetical protein
MVVVMIVVRVDQGLPSVQALYGCPFTSKFGSDNFIAILNICSVHRNNDRNSNSNA